METFEHSHQPEDYRAILPEEFNRHYAQPNLPLSAERHDQLNALLQEKERSALERSNAQLIRRQASAQIEVPADLLRTDSTIAELMDSRRAVLTHLSAAQRVEYEQYLAQGATYAPTSEALEPVLHAIDKIEEQIFAPLPDKEEGVRNPLFLKNDPNRPSHGKIGRLIRELREYRDEIARGIGDANDRSSLIQRIDRAIQAAQLLTARDEFGRARYEFQTAQKSSLLAKPLRAAGLAVASLFTVMTVIPVVTKIFSNQELEMADSFVVAYMIATAKLAGFKLSENKAQQVLSLTREIEQRHDFKDSLQRIVSQHSTDTLTEGILELRSIKRANLRTLLKQPHGITDKQLAELVEEEPDSPALSPLRKILSTQGITPQLRKEFIEQCMQLKLYKDSNLAVALTLQLSPPPGTTTLSSSTP